MAHIGLVTLVVRDYDEAIDSYVRIAGFRLVEDTRLDDRKRWDLIQAAAAAVRENDRDEQ